MACARVCVVHGARSADDAKRPIPTVQPLSTMLMFDSRLSKATATKLHDLYLCVMRDPLFRQLFSMAMLTGT